MIAGIDQPWSYDMLVRPRDLADRIAANNSLSYSRCPLMRLAAKPAKLSISPRRTVSQQSFRVGDNSLTVRLNSQCDIFRIRIDVKIQARNTENPPVCVLAGSPLLHPHPDVRTTYFRSLISVIGCPTAHKP